MKLFTTLRASALCAVMVATVLVAAVPVQAADVLEFDLDGHTLRMERQEGYCLLERDNPDHASAWQYIDIQMGGRPVFAAAALCDGDDAADFRMLTAIFALPEDLGLSPTQVDRASSVNLERVPLVVTDPARFATQTFGAFRARPKRESGSRLAPGESLIGGLFADDIWIQAAEFVLLDPVILLEGWTPVETTVVHTFTVDVIRTEVELAEAAALHRRLLQNVRANNPARMLTRGSSPVPSTAANAVREFEVEGQTLRLGPIGGLCVLDRDDPAHVDAWRLVDDQMRGVVVIAAVAHCSETERSGLVGLTAIYAEPGDIGLPRERVESRSGAALELVPVMFDDPEVFVAETTRLFDEAATPNTKLAGFHADNVLVEAFDLSSPGLHAMLVTGLTPTRNMIVQTLTIDYARDKDALEFFALIHRRVLTSIREHTPSVALRRR